jgi:hypothetical protein
MTQPPATPDSPLHARIAAVTDRIAQARADVAESRTVDLGGLEERIDAICRLVQQPEHRSDEAVRGLLAAMLGELDALEADLTAQRDTLMGEPGGAVAPKTAASAYSKNKG